MANYYRRQDDRTDGVDSECYLIDDYGSMYDANLENISDGGALLMIGEDITNMFNVGYEFGFMTLNYQPKNRFCKVVRQDSSSVAVCFIP